MPRASRSIGVGPGKHTVDFIWRGYLIEIKSGKSINMAQLTAISSEAAKRGFNFVYYFLKEPPKAVKDQILNAGGNVVYFY